MFMRWLGTGAHDNLRGVFKWRVTLKFLGHYFYVAYTTWQAEVSGNKYLAKENPMVLWGIRSNRMSSPCLKQRQDEYT